MVPIKLCIEPAMKSAAEAAALDDRRSLSSLVEKVLADYLIYRGYLTSERPSKQLDLQPVQATEPLVGEAVVAVGNGQLIKEARERLGISQEELARRLNVTKGAISQWENGITAPSRSNGRLLESVLGIDRTLWV